MTVQPQMVSLTSLASEVPGVRSVSAADIEVDDVTHDSRSAGPGVVFVAIDGLTVDGHLFVADAVAAGSPAVVVERPVDVDVPQIVVEDSRRALAHVASAVHGHPTRDLVMVGVTGTNGKTTVNAMCEAVMAAAGRPTGVIGTLGARIDGVPVPLKRTTPESSDLQRLLASMRDADVGTVFMEVSSHALDLHRADAIVFDVGAFTNLSQDHLDFHGTMEAYFEAKQQLFADGRTNHAVVNIGDAAGIRLATGLTMPTTTVGVGVDADVVLTILSESEQGSTFSIADGDRTLEVAMPLPGSFNTANAAVAYAICRNLDVDSDVIVEGLQSLGPVAGRMQSIDRDADVAVIVDYAHTPAAIETVLSSARRMTSGRVIAVIGAGGDRDHEKRPIMGRAAATHADFIIVTTDNPRSEDPKDIVRDVALGLLAVPSSQFETVVDRGEAIAYAVNMAEPGDVVLILGRGHEPTQEVLGELLPFDDVEVARAALDGRGGSRS